MKVPERVRKRAKPTSASGSGTGQATDPAPPARALAMPGLARGTDDPARRAPTATPTDTVPGWQGAAPRTQPSGGTQLASARRPNWTAAAPTGGGAAPRSGILGGSRRSAPVGTPAPSPDLGYYDAETTHPAVTGPSPMSAYDARVATRVTVDPAAEVDPYNTDDMAPSNAMTAPARPTAQHAGPQQVGAQQVVPAAPRRGPAPLPSLAPRSAPGDGTGRKHRAFQLNKLPDFYSEETQTHDAQGNARPNHLVGGGIAGICDKIKLLWTALTAPGTLIMEEYTEVFTMAETKAGFTKPRAPENLRAAAQAAHAFYMEWLRREELLVTDDGQLYHKMPDGRLEYYPTAADGTPIVHDRHVKYDQSAESQEATRVEFRGGKLFRSATHAEKGGPVDTSQSVTHFSGPGYEIFVVDEKNEIHMASHKIGKYHHSSLLNGGAVSMAGELKVVDGKIAFMSNKSGHYNPSEAAFTQFLRFLQKDAIPLDFEVNDFSNARKMTAQEWLDGKQPNGNYDPSRTLEAIKTDVVWKAFLQEFGATAVMAVITDQGWSWRDSRVVDNSGTAVDPKLVRRLLKQELGGKRPGQGRQAKVKVDTVKNGITVDSEWKS